MFVEALEVVMQKYSRVSSTSGTQGSRPVFLKPSKCVFTDCFEQIFTVFLPAVFQLKCTCFSFR